MKTTFKALTYSAVLAGIMTLAACSSNSSNGNASQTNPVPSVPAAQTSSPGGSTAGGAGSSETGSSATGTSVTGGAADSSSPAGSTAGQSTGSGKTTTTNDDDTAQLKELLASAKKGRIPGIPFAAHTNLIEDVQKSWGKADNTDAAGKGLYATYSKKHAVIGFNKGEQIFDVRSNDPKLQTLTLKQIEQTLGKPADITKNGDDSIYIYQANSDYQLKFIIPKSTGKVDHISVYAPKDSINNMAG
ncbi:YjgB family protein [Paenibacillus humicola]|uniref:YjgB family protein n=1 Tax=Paenibacillus humicola TaxID=3110540 RepID=UPI00237A3BE8|nr:YjgB family protein [Paenibacillus humicola]